VTLSLMMVVDSTFAPLATRKLNSCKKEKAAQHDVVLSRNAPIAQAHIGLAHVVVESEEDDVSRHGDGRVGRVWVEHRGRMRIWLLSSLAIDLRLPRGKPGSVYLTSASVSDS
jgi:hypothetical protein